MKKAYYKGYDYLYNSFACMRVKSDKGGVDAADGMGLESIFSRNMTKVGIISSERFIEYVDKYRAEIIPDKCTKCDGTGSLDITDDDGFNYIVECPLCESEGVSYVKPESSYHFSISGECYYPGHFDLIKNEDGVLNLFQCQYEKNRSLEGRKMCVIRGSKAEYVFAPLSELKIKDSEMIEVKLQ